MLVFTIHEQFSRLPNRNTRTSAIWDRDLAPLLWYACLYVEGATDLFVIVAGDGQDVESTKPSTSYSDLRTRNRSSYEERNAFPPPAARRPPPTHNPDDPAAKPRPNYNAPAKRECNNESSIINFNGLKKILSTIFRVTSLTHSARCCYHPYKCNPDPNSSHIPPN